MDLSTPHVLAIDHGTSGLKVALVDIHGEVVDFEFEKTPLHFLPGGGAEQDPEEWWLAFMISAKRLLAKKTVPTGNIVAICVSSTFSSTVAVGQNGRHLMNSFTWMDSRGAPYIREAVKGFPSIKGYGLANIIRWIRLTGGGPSITGKDDIAHVLLTKNEYPEIYEQTYKFLGSKDYLNLRLTGEFAASYDSVMLFWVTDIRDINNITYSDQLIERLNIDKAKLPVLKQSTEVLGTLSPKVAGELGLQDSVKVVMGSPDHQSACIGSGAVRDYEGHIYIGTSSWIETIVPRKKTDMLHSIAALPTAIPGKYQCINEQDIAGGCLTFLLENIFFHQNEFCKGPLPENPYEILDRIVAKVPAGSRKLIFTPWLNGERTPVDSASLRSGLMNMSLSTTNEDIARAVFEGVAYNTKWSLKYVERFIKRRMGTLNMIGGGAQSDVWCQIFADVLNRNIRKVKDPIQANARGAALIAAVGLGYISFTDIPELIEFDRTFEPNGKNRGIYDQLFDEFMMIYKNNRKLYKRLNQKRALRELNRTDNE